MKQKKGLLSRWHHSRHLDADVKFELAVLDEVLNDILKEEKNLPELSDRKEKLKSIYQRKNR